MDNHLLSIKNIDGDGDDYIDKMNCFGYVIIKKSTSRIDVL